MNFVQKLPDDKREDITNLAYSRRNRPDVFIKSERMKFVVLALSAEYANLRKDRGQRKINEADLPAYFRHLNNIVTDLYAAWLDDPEKYVGYSRGKHAFHRGGSYWDFNKDEPLLSQRIFLNLIDFLDEQGYIKNRTATAGRNPYSSRMRANPKLIELVQAQNITWASIRTDISKSAIVVKDKDKKVIPPPDGNNFDLEQAEANLRRINENLQTSLINLNVTDEEYEALRGRMRQGVDNEQEAHELEGQREPLDFSNRSLKRIFAHGSFDYGGRFYGGWWQGVPSDYRKYIEIDGGITVEMDFSTIQPRILYAMAEAEPHEDAYAVPGWDADLRPVIKKAFNHLLNSKEGSKNENQWHRFTPGTDPDPIPQEWAEMTKHQRAVMRREEFEKRTGRKYDELLHDLKAMHEPIDRFFFSEAWAWLQRIDSDIAERVMLKLIDQQHTALPIHDSFIVRRRAEDVLLHTMNEAFVEVVGAIAKIDRNDTVFDGEGCRLMHYERRYFEARELLIDRDGYHRRDFDWKVEWGLGRNI
jgi:hypothetical protein